MSTIEELKLLLQQQEKKHQQDLERLDKEVRAEFDVQIKRKVEGLEQDFLHKIEEANHELNKAHVDMATLRMENRHLKERTYEDVEMDDLGSRRADHSLAGDRRADHSLAGDRPPRMPTIWYEDKDTDDWHMFADGFKNLAEVQLWSDTVAKHCLKYCMRGRAAKAVHNIDHKEAGLTLEILLKKYEDKFMPPSASAVARNRFEHSVQLPQEGVLQFHARAWQLYCRAYPDVCLISEALCIRQFIRGLHLAEVRKQVQFKEPKTYEAALQAAQMVIAVFSEENFVPGLHNAAKETRKILPPDVNAVGTWDVAALNSQLRCHGCNGVGHFARDCPKNLKEAAKSYVPNADGILIKKKTTPFFRPRNPAGTVTKEALQQALLRTRDKTTGRFRPKKRTLASLLAEELEEDDVDWAALAQEVNNLNCNDDDDEDDGTEVPPDDDQAEEGRGQPAPGF